MIFQVNKKKKIFLLIFKVSFLKIFSRKYVIFKKMFSVKTDGALVANLNTATTTTSVISIIIL